MSSAVRFARCYFLGPYLVECIIDIWVCDPSYEVPGVSVSLDPGSDAALLAGDQSPRGRLLCLCSCAAGIETSEPLGHLCLD